MLEIIIAILLGLIIGSIIFIFISPWFSLWRLKDIADELTNIREELEKLNEWSSTGD